MVNNYIIESGTLANKADVDRQRDTLKVGTSGIWRFIRRLSIAKKISYGYSLAIGIAILGTTVGLAIGDYYQKQAHEQLTLVNKQQELLRDLENAVWAVRSHPQRLGSVLGKSILFAYESDKFLGEVTRVEALLDELEYFADRHQANLAVDAREFKDLLKGYEKNIKSYEQLIESVWEQIDAANLKAEEIPAARQAVFVATSEDIAIKIDFQFERLTENLNRILAAAQTQQAQANARFKKAEVLRLQIMVGIMLLSCAIAAVLAFYTSRAIARPLEWVTQVAGQVTHKANFNLMAPVLTEDEVGSLAISLNQLIKWVGEYTHDLELARQTLEQRVEERTQELEQARQTLEQRVEERTQELREALEDLKQTQAQLIQTEKMSSLGQLVAGIAHEINNPVNFIHGNLKYVSDYTQELVGLISLYQQRCTRPDPEIQKRIKKIDLDFMVADLGKIVSSMKMGTQRIREIVQSLRNFSRLDEAEVKAVDIHEGIDNTLLILNHRLKQEIEVIKQYGDLPKVECYPAQLNQVFMNILANAIDALEESGSLVKTRFISSRSGVKSQQSIPQILIQTSRIDSNHIRVVIRDNGPGIIPEIMGKLFDPFFTTKPVGKGTGIGLSICYQIIEKHKGKIEVISEPGQGTEFAIALPIQAQKAYLH